MPFEESLHHALGFRKIVRFDFPALIAEVKTVGGDFQEEDYVGLAREFLVEEEEARLDPE